MLVEGSCDILTNRSQYYAAETPHGLVHPYSIGNPVVRKASSNILTMEVTRSNLRKQSFVADSRAETMKRSKKLATCEILV